MIDKERADLLGVHINFNIDPITVFSAEDLDSATKSELRYILGDKTSFEVADQAEHQNFINAKEQTKSINLQIDQFVTDEEFQRSAKIALNAAPDADTPAIRLFNNLISVAIARGASDIHIDPTSQSLLIKMRFDGILMNYAELDKRISKMLAARIKLLSGMDITERRKPQDGRFTVIHKGKSVDIRSASMPVQAGERIALRIFNQDPNVFTLENTGLSEGHIKALRKVILKQNGLIMVCGPTGSGKTTTIYSLLNELKGRGLNVMTIEDPVEIDFDDIVQTQVDETVAFDFANGLKSLMRNDPDVILVGEIRDEETAQIAVRAAMTGHLVITTVHANNPIGSLKRLLNLNVDATLLSDCLLGVFSQRLVRLYCEKCGSQSVMSAAHTSKAQATLKGCDHCFNTGFQSRKPVMSHILIDTSNKRLLEGAISDLDFQDSMTDEAQTLHQQNRIPLSEVIKLESL
jgi:type II secretory ATPase GspE/PulE/Tfp pilus assembly ATPase PilB-like protein